MKDEDIHIGDVLYLKEWNEMLWMGKINDYGDLEITNRNLYKVSIPSETRVICGCRFTVKQIHKKNYGLLYEAEEHGMYGAIAEMLCQNPNEETQFNVATDDEIALLLSLKNNRRLVVE